MAVARQLLRDACVKAAIVWMGYMTFWAFELVRYTFGW